MGFIYIMVKKFLIIKMRSIGEHIAKLLTMIIRVGTDNMGQPIYINPNRVVLENYPNFIKPSTGLFISIYTTGTDIYGISRKYNTTSGFKETITENRLTKIAIEFLSKDETALVQKDYLPLYLSSYTSTNYQMENGFTIEPIQPSFFNLGRLEGADRVHRFRFEYKIFHGLSITSDIPYYDNNFNPSINI